MKNNDWYKVMKCKNNFLFIASFVVIVFAIYKFGGNYLSNRWLLLTGRGYSIPYESSIYKFNPTVMNEGSGEWWIYGEDDSRYYYAGDGISPYSYIMITKKDAKKCSDFDAINFKTWCTKEHPKKPNP